MHIFMLLRQRWLQLKVVEHLALQVAAIAHRGKLWGRSLRHQGIDWPHLH